MTSPILGAEQTTQPPASPDCDPVSSPATPDVRSPQGASGGNLQAMKAVLDREARDLLRKELEADAAKATTGRDVGPNGQPQQFPTTRKREVVPVLGQRQRSDSGAVA